VSCFNSNKTIDKLFQVGCLRVGMFQLPFDINRTIVKASKGPRQIGVSVELNSGAIGLKRRDLLLNPGEVACERGEGHRNLDPH
jgi:hypothetical protein